ncbi:MAG: homoserine O-succinyltransferase [Eubacteriales bacterium]
MPAVDALAQENIFVMPQHRAATQDIRPARIAILNLMPTKQATETQILRLLANTPLQVEVTLLRTGTYQSQNTSQDYLDSFYRTFDEVKNEHYDGLRHHRRARREPRFSGRALPGCSLVRLMDWADRNVFSTLYICWRRRRVVSFLRRGEASAAQEDVRHLPACSARPRAYARARVRRAGYGAALAAHDDLCVGRGEDTDLDILATSQEAGLYSPPRTSGRRRVFVTGHSEYDAKTLELEYRRDKNAANPSICRKTYYPNNDDTLEPMITWRAHGALLFSNWLNYFVYQETPYDINAISAEYGQ